MRMNKYLKKTLIFLGILAGLILIINLGINLWVKYQLPNYIKNNSNYNISYKTLDVDLGTGNIHATGISINTKNAQDRNILGFQGTIDSLSVKRFGILDALINKEFNTSGLRISKPNLNIILAQKKPHQKKKPKDISFDYIQIREGNITVFKDNLQKFAAAKNINLNLENLELKQDTDSPIPASFDNYSLNGEDIYFRPDNIYLMKATNIKTEKGNLNIQNFHLIPLLTYAQFTKFYPKKRNLFDFQTREVNFKDFSLTKKELKLNQIKFSSPILKMFTTNVKPQEKKKSFKYIVNLEDVIAEKAQIEILKPNGNQLFFTPNIDMSINKLVVDDQTAKGNIPFQYENFKIVAQDLNYNSDTQKVIVKAAALNNKSADLRYIFVKPTVSSSAKTLMDFSVDHVNFIVNSWKLENNKLSLDAKSFLVDKINGNISAPEQTVKKPKPTFSGIAFPLKLENFTLKNSNLTYNKGNKPLTLNELNASIHLLEMNEETIKSDIPFKTENFSLKTNNFVYNVNPFYKLSVGSISMDKKSLQISNFAMKPLVSRAQFIKMIPTERDLYDLKASSIVMNGSWDLISSKQFINASQLTLNGVNADIFRSKIPKDDPKIKPMYSELLRKIKFPMQIQNTDIKNSVLVYEEDTPKSDGPGKLTFGNFNMNIKNLNSGKTNGQSTQVPMTIHCSFMNASPMNVKWIMNTASMDDAFTISGNISDLAAPNINAFIEPYLKVRAKGTIQDLNFDFHGNKTGIAGAFKMKHKDLTVSLLNESGEKKKLLSAVANMFVKTNSDKFPESVTVEKVQRDPTKSFFNMFWKGVQQGLKLTLIGSNIDKVKNTVQYVKEVKKDVKSTVKDLKITIKETKSSKSQNNSSPTEEQAPEKKKGFFKRVFEKKKEE